MVDRYHLRPAYPQETIEVLASLARGGAVLEAGAGTGELARRLAPHVERVDAIDVSERMIVRGRSMIGGDAENIRWICGAVEHAPLAPPYSLIVAADSLHWFDWQVVSSKFEALLDREGALAIVKRVSARDPRLRDGLTPIFARHASNPDFEPLDPAEEFLRRGLLVKSGEWSSGPVSWRPTIDEFVDAIHSTSGLAIERISDPTAFGRELRDVLRDHVTADGKLDLDVLATIVWGRPKPAPPGPV